MARNIAETVTHYAKELAGLKYLPALALLILVWQAAALGGNLYQSVAAPTVAAKQFYTPPQFQENFYGDAGWGWSNHKNLYVQKEKPQAPPSINLAVTLLGILNFGDTGFAMMKVDKGKETLYGLGDNVKGNVKLKHIGIDSVTLSDGTTEKTYGLTAKKSNIFLERANAPKATNLITANAPAPPAAAPRQNVRVSALPPANRDRLVQVEQKFRENPLAASSDFDVNAVNKEGKVYGYRVNYRVDPALLRSIGLLPTDIIISVNSIPAPVIASNSAVLNNLMKEKNFTIIYERNGARNTLNINR